MNYERREREVERKLGVNFINIFQATFLYESVLHSFSLVTVFPAKAIFYVCALIFYMCEGLSQVILGARSFIHVENMPKNYGFNIFDYESHDL